MFSRRSLVLVVMYMQRHCVSARGLAMPARRRFQIKYTLSRQAAQRAWAVCPCARSPGLLSMLGAPPPGGRCASLGRRPHYGLPATKTKRSSEPCQRPAENSARPDPAGGSCSAVHTNRRCNPTDGVMPPHLQRPPGGRPFTSQRTLAQTAQSTTPSLSAKPPHIAAMVALASASSADPARRASDRSLRLRRRLACAA